MADVKAGQKVRIWDGTNELGDEATSPFIVQLSDGADLALIDGSGNLNVILASNDGTDIGDVTVNNAAGASAVNIQDGGNSITVDGSVSITGGAVDDSAFVIGTDAVNPAAFLADETTPDSVDEGDVGLARMTLDRRQLMVLTDSTTESQRLAIDSSGNMQIDIAATSLAASTPIPVSATAAQNTELNPIFVQVVTTATSAEEVHDYDTAAAVAADATDNHDYTVAGTTFLLKSVIVSASSSGKWEVQTGPVATLTTDAVIFTSESSLTKQINFDPPIEVPVTSTGTVRIIRTNTDNQAQDLYSTIIGNDV